MNIDKDKIHESFVEYLAKNGLRKTVERETILHQICLIQGHFDVESLQQRLENEKFRVSRASIYNTIELLMNAQLVVRHQFSTQLVKYELRSSSSTHHHLICNYCGAIREFKDLRLTKEILSFRLPKFTYEDHSLYIYGICSKCKYRLNKRKKRTEKK